MNLELATRFARSTLGHVRREYPHGLAHVTYEPEDLTPSILHPIFHGSFDWHSCVHGRWQLLRLARLFPELSTDIYALANTTFTPDNAEGELNYLIRQPSFERPYGWAWFLALHGEALRHDAPWADALEPIARLLAARFADYLPKLTYPVRAGTHSNTAFALIFVHKWATEHDQVLAEIVASWAQNRFNNDRAAPLLEPSGEDFLSPTLTEVLLMSRVMPGQAFDRWFAAFMPELPENLLAPAQVSDREDGRIGHLDGLNLSRAWCWRELADRLPEIRDIANLSAERHLNAALPHLTDGYMAEHWLATFALLAETA